MKKTIVIASVLKPVDDIRAYEKIAQSITKTNKYAVNIIGNAGKNISKDQTISFYPHRISSSSVIKRLIARKKILTQILKLKPQLLIVSTHELLHVALLSKLFIRCKIIYDVQENYASNLRYINPNSLKRIYASIVQFKEWISQAYISHYWLAEKCYFEQMNFVKHKYSVIENKAKEASIIRTKSIELKLLFSGTISNYGGVKNAVHLLEKIQVFQPSASLKIIGQIHDNDLEKYLRKKQKEIPNIELDISSLPITHDQIMEAISSSTLGVIGYEINEVNRNKIPTKLYEYSRYQLPYVVAENSHWFTVGTQLGGAIPVDFTSPNIDRLLDSTKKFDFLFPNPYPIEATWEYESDKLIKSINTLTD